MSSKGLVIHHEHDPMDDYIDGLEAAAKLCMADGERLEKVWRKKKGDTQWAMDQATGLLMGASLIRDEAKRLRTQQEAKLAI